MADLIADTILDTCLEQDKDSRVACEVLLSNENMFVVGELSSLPDVDVTLDVDSDVIINPSGRIVLG